MTFYRIDDELHRAFKRSFGMSWCERAWDNWGHVNTCLIMFGSAFSAIKEVIS